MYYKKLVGERIYLSPMDIEHEVDTLTTWLNEDQDIAYNNGFYHRLLGKEKSQALLQQWNEGPFSFSVISLQNDAFLGHISLFQIDAHELYATMGAYIGKQHRNHGYGREAMKLLIDYAFQTQRLQAIHIEAFDFNDHGLHTYPKLGFQECGRWHQSLYHMGEYHDIVMMELLRKDWDKTN